MRTLMSVLGGLDRYTELIIGEIPQVEDEK